VDLRQDWVSFRCACGFCLERVPRRVVADLPRCLGCGRPLRGARVLKTRGLADVRDLR